MGQFDVLIPEDSLFVKKLFSWAWDIDLFGEKKLKILELAAGRGELSVLAEVYGHEVICTDIDCYYGLGATNWIRESGSGLSNTGYFSYFPEAIRNLAVFVRNQFDVIALNGFHMVFQYAQSYTKAGGGLSVEDVLAEHISYFLPLLTNNGKLQMRSSLMFPGELSHANKITRIQKTIERLASSWSIEPLRAGIDEFPHSPNSPFDVAIVLRKTQCS